MKKIFSLMLCVLLAFNLFTFPASAADDAGGLTEGVFSGWRTPDGAFAYDPNKYGVTTSSFSDGFYAKFTKTGDSEDYFLPRLRSGFFKFKDFVATGNFTISYPAFTVTVPAEFYRPYSFVNLIMDCCYFNSRGQATSAGSVSLPVGNRTYSEDGSMVILTSSPAEQFISPSVDSDYFIDIRGCFNFAPDDPIGACYMVSSDAPIRFTSNTEGLTLAPSERGGIPGVSAPGSAQGYSITLPTVKGVTVTTDLPTLEVGYGSTYHFTVDIADNYQQTDDFAVTVNGSPVFQVDGVYTVEYVTAPQTIGVSGVEHKPYEVTLIQGEGYTLSFVDGFTSVTDNVALVPYNALLSVSVTAKDGYLLPAGNGSARFGIYGEGGLALIAPYKDGVISFRVNTGMFNSFDIWFVDVKKLPEYTITLPDIDGCEVIPVNGSASPVFEGGSYSFTLKLEDKYIKTDDFAVKVNDSVYLPDSNDVYTIENITEDLTITVDGIIRLRPAHAVTLPSGVVGFFVAPAPGSTSPVEDGDNYSFSVHLAFGYRKSDNFSVKANGVELSSIGGTYTIYNVTAPQTITVTGVEKIPSVLPGFDGLKNLIISVFGEYTPVTTTATVESVDDNVTTTTLYTTVAPGVAGVDWEWVSGAGLFLLLLYGALRLFGGVFRK